MTLTRALIVACKIMIPVFCIQRTAIRQNIDYLKQLIKIFILLFGKLQILFKLIGKLNVVSSEAETWAAEQGKVPQAPFVAVKTL